jgi:cytochrome c oxidase subunit 2
MSPWAAAEACALLLVLARRAAAGGPAGAGLGERLGRRPLQRIAPAGVQAARIHQLWTGTLWLCTAVFAAVLLALLLALVRAARAERSAASKQEADSRTNPWIRGATVLCGVLLAGLVAIDVWTDHALAKLPVGQATRFEMIGYQWWWEARFPASNGQPGFGVSGDIHVPVGQPVVVTLKSADVIHSFWVPNLHGKKDMLPGRTTTIAFQADAPGLYRGQCAEFCGAEHALMAFGLHADTPADFARWHAAQQAPAAAPTSPDAVRGQAIFLASACAGCHTVRGTAASGGLGPDLTHVASRTHIAAGTVPNDAAHLLQWVRDPQSLKPGATMPASALPPDDLQAVVAYLGELR